MRDQNEFMRQMLDLVEFAKTNENRITKEQVDDFCQDMKLQKSQLKLVYEFLEEHHIEVENEDEFLLAKMDAKLIVQVVINIVDNAIKYTPKGSHILISTKKQYDKAVISIADDGAGIPDEMKPRVFDMFFSGANQIADSRRSLGLGLSLCKSIINAHGGCISVSDNPPHGTVFTFTLPAGEVELHE